jgi:hypothetical protein
MLSSHTPLRRFERTLSVRPSYYLIDAAHGSAAYSVSRRLNRARSPQVVAHRDNPVLVAA